MGLQWGFIEAWTAGDDRTTFFLRSMPSPIAPMPEAPLLGPITSDEIADGQSFAIRCEGRKRAHHADDAMARITADRLVRRLTAAGFVVMRAHMAAAAAGERWTQWANPMDPRGA